MIGIIPFMLISALAAVKDPRPETSFSSIVGLCISLLRKRKQLSQAALADRSKLSQTTISRIELGESDITLAQFESICSALGVTSSNLMAAFHEIRKVLEQANIEVSLKNPSGNPGENFVHLTSRYSALSGVYSINAVAAITSLAASVLSSLKLEDTEK